MTGVRLNNMVSNEDQSMRDSAIPNDESMTRRSKSTESKRQLKSNLILQRKRSKMQS